MTKDITSEDFAPDLLLALLAVREAAWAGMFFINEHPVIGQDPNTKLIARMLWAASDHATEVLADYGLLPM